MPGTRPGVTEFYEAFLFGFLAAAFCAAASFAVCPLIPDEFMAPLQVRSGEIQILAFELTPWLLDPPAEVLTRLESIIASLAWSCRRSE